MKEKIKINVQEMGEVQCLNWIEEIFSNNPLGTTEDVASKEVIHKLRLINNDKNANINNLQKVIDSVLEGTKLSGKDKGDIIRLILFN